jgi:signal transduction histidine kinase
VLIQKERLASLGQLIGGIAHSLKTPISTASDAAVCLDNLAEEYDQSIDIDTVTREDHHSIAADMKNHIKDLIETIDYMNSIINTVKNYSADLEKPAHEEFFIKDLINSINILMSNELKKNGCKLNIYTNMSGQEVLKGDIRNLIQIVNVLISNAIQSYTSGNGQIDLSIQKIHEEVEIAVKDYGRGIPRGIQDKILNKMVTTKGGKGTGIGLYISNSIIKARFHGSMSFESEEGKGTTFRMTLPIRKEENEA